MTSSTRPASTWFLIVFIQSFRLLSLGVTALTAASAQSRAWHWSRTKVTFRPGKAASQEVRIQSALSDSANSLAANKPFRSPNCRRRAPNSELQPTTPAARALSMQALTAPLVLSFRGSPVFGSRLSAVKQTTVFAVPSACLPAAPLNLARGHLSLLLYLNHDISFPSPTLTKADDGAVRVERTHCRCRDCRCGFRQLDRTLGLEGKTVTTSAESLYADAASSDSYEEAGRKLKNLAGVEVPASTLQRYVAGILTACEETLAGPDMTFILDLFHALEYAAVRDATPDEGKRTVCMDWIREQLNAGQAAQVIAILEPHRRRSEAVAACIRYYQTNAGRMQCDLYRTRGLPVGSGVVESACKHIVGNRFKKAGCRWSKAGANALLAAEKTRPIQTGDPNRRLNWLVTKTSKTSVSQP